MPSLSTLASSLVGEWAKASLTDADSEKLYAALGNVDAYSPEVTTYLCVYKITGLETQGAGTTNYKFDVTGCNADKEFVGRCPDLTSFPGCGSYNIVVSDNKVTSITGQKLKATGKCQGM
ncbi:hypothetical protein V7S43_016494 [Phytophthora oleae]|uniref:Cystatin domain-containing protein n=1 Tax=Phytophthora oleae TaxID=2107226 RepID=A0ABD3EXG2_9STRA